MVIEYTLQLDPKPFLLEQFYSKLNLTNYNNYS